MTAARCLVAVLLALGLVACGDDGTASDAKCRGWEADFWRARDRFDRAVVVEDGRRALEDMQAAERKIREGGCEL